MLMKHRKTNLGPIIAAMIIVLAVLILSGKPWVDITSYTSYDPDQGPPTDTNALTFNPERPADEAALDLIYLTVYPDNKKNVETMDRRLMNLAKDEGLEVYFRSAGGEGTQNLELIQEANATISLRGRSYKDPQKSYKIRLFSKAGLWHGQNIINLDKCYDDPLRIRNKLTQDTFMTLPGISGIRTRFVRLFVRESAGEGYGEYKDLGFYIQKEQMNRLYLSNRGVSTEGSLYVAESFNFEELPAVMNGTEEATYSQKDFEKHLQIRGNQNHFDLIRFIRDVNDPKMDINETAEKYLDRENYLTWTAAAILMDIEDSGRKGYGLYRPAGGNCWYHLPEDSTRSWHDAALRQSWRKGLYLSWDNVLYRRFYSVPQNVEALTKRMDELKGVLGKEQSGKRLESYRGPLLANLTKLPDYAHLGMRYEAWVQAYDDLAGIPEKNYRTFMESLKTPPPFVMQNPTRNGAALELSWSPAVSPVGESVSYTLDISPSPQFTSTVYRMEKLTDVRHTVPSLPAGTYYWRVTAVTDAGRTQMSLNEFEDIYGNDYPGTMLLKME